MFVVVVIRISLGLLCACVFVCWVGFRGLIIFCV